MSVATDKALFEQACDLHARLPVVLGYLNSCDEPFKVSDGHQSDLEKLDAAGIRLFVASIGFGCYFQIGPNEYAMAGPDEWILQHQLRRIDYLLANIEKCPRTRLIRTRGDLDAVLDSPSDIGVIVHLTGNQHTVDLAAVDRFFERGVRATHPAMQYHNRWCEGGGSPITNGKAAPVLSDFGRQVIARMNELGITIDTAHASDASAIAIAEVSSRPVNDSHTGSSELCGHDRGLADQTLRAVGKTGGVIGIHFADHMLVNMATTGGEPTEETQQRWAFYRHVIETIDDPDERLRYRKGSFAREALQSFCIEQGWPVTNPTASAKLTPGCNVAQMADHIEHLVNVVGIEHVGLGGDVNGIGDDQWPTGMTHVGDLPVLTAELLSRGWTERELLPFLSNNWLRVFQENLPA